MKRYLEYKAGPAALDIVREEGLKPERVGVFAAPAGGPKWFVSVGFDKALMRSSFLQIAGGRVSFGRLVRGRVEVSRYGVQESFERVPRTSE